MEALYRDCNINVKINQKIPVVFYNPKNYDFYLIMKYQRKFNLNINIIPNGLEKYMSFSINCELRFVDDFRFFSSSLVILVKNFSEEDFKYLIQEFHGVVLDLVKQKGFYPYEYLNGFESFQEELLSKEN